MNGNIPKDKLISVVVFCARTSYKPQTVYNAISSGTGELSKLPFFRIGRSIRFSENDTDRFLEQRRVAPRTGKPE
jgi:predicted DNA-binding transcriptional regulator AlpA